MEGFSFLGHEGVKRMRLPRSFSLVRSYGTGWRSRRRNTNGDEGHVSVVPPRQNQSSTRPYHQLITARVYPVFHFSFLFHAFFLPLVPSPLSCPLNTVPLPLRAPPVSSSVKFVPIMALITAS